MNYWLIKSEPSVYPFHKLWNEKSTQWDGIRNFQARNNLALMKTGDLCLYYHSNGERAVVGLAKVSTEAFPDPTATDPRWLAVRVAAVSELQQPISLSTIKQDPILQHMELVRQSRLSVCPVRPEEFDRVIELSGTQF